MDFSDNTDMYRNIKKNTSSKNISSQKAWYKKTNRDVAIGPGMYTVYCIG